MPRRPRRSQSRRRTRVGGQEDDGTAALHEFLKPYERISLEDACANDMQHPKLFVWHSAGNRWAQMEQDKVDDLWDHKKQNVKNPHDSLARHCVAHGAQPRKVKRNVFVSAKSYEN